MEKISGIVPATSRVTSVNLKESQTMRPGAPGFGAPVGKAAINGGNQPTTAEKAVAAHNALMSRRSGDAHHPQLIKDMTDKFFMQNESGPGGVINDIDLNYQMDRMTAPVLVEARPLNVPDASLDVMAADIEGDSQEPEWMIAESQSDESDYVPPGSYLDVTV